MKRGEFLLLAGLGCVAIGGGLMLVNKNAPAAAATARAHRIELAKPVPRSAHALGAYRPSSEHAADTPVEPAAPAALPTAEEVPTPQDQVDYVDTVFRDQPADRAWAATAESILRSELTKRAERAAEVTSVECRQSLCKVTLSYQSTVDQGKLAASIFGLPEYWPGARMILAKEGPSGALTGATLFYAKEGAEMPRLD